MSDHFTDHNNAKLSNSVDNLDYYEEELTESGSIDELNSSYDHMYATNHQENGISEDPQASCQSESGVKFLKEFLLIHLDLIQQQNDDIVNKENTIFILQQENARLRERLRCMESGSPYQSSSKVEKPSEENSVEDMTQDSGPADDENTDTVVQIPEADCPQTNFKVENSGLESKTPVEQIDNQLLNENIISESTQSETDVEEFQAAIKREPEEKAAENKTIKEDETSDFNKSQNSELTYSNTSYTIHSNSFNSSDPMKNLKMSIRRKRLCSNSSAVSNNDSMSDEKRNFRRSRKKRKRIVKNDYILTHNDQYLTQVGDQLLDAIRRQELADEAVRAASTSSLEVPRWRVKVYTSCYSMEGTENLDDDVFLRRHNRLENDERRRKRWDIQRIREQRIIEKLKQRQDKIDANKAGIEQTEIIESLWPPVEDVKYIEMSDVLPVSAFGCPIPKIQPSEFTLPWLQNPNLKKLNVRKASSRRRGAKR